MTGLSIIGSKRGTPGGVVFTGINPANGSPLPGQFHSAPIAEVDLAARLAGEAFEEFSRWPGPKRAALLDGIASGLEARGEAIIERANQETALPTARLQGELARTCFQLRLLGKAAERGLSAGIRIDHGDPGRKPLPKPDLRSYLRPLGPVAVFGASNFPLAFSVAGGDTASALAAGCPVIVKAHPAHPGTSEMVGSIIQKSVSELSAPEGVFSLLFDAGLEIGAALTKHPRVKAVAFTGSLSGGRALMDLAAAREEPIPVYAEMSSVNPTFILPSILESAAEEIAVGLYASVVLGVGQFCTNPGLVFIESTPGESKFLNKLKELFNSSAPGVMLTPSICDSYLQGIEAFFKIPGVKMLALAKVDSFKACAAVFVTDFQTYQANQLLRREVFGPSTLVVECSSREQMLEAARDLSGQLTASIHAGAQELADNRDLVQILATKAGRLLFNGFPTGVEVTHAMIHGGPYPATSDGRSTSVGTSAIERFLRPISFQNFPDAALPTELQESNPLNLIRLVDGKWELNQEVV
jgi:NADP-dependent aldehyde dehydrogenase